MISILFLEKKEERKRDKARRREKSRAERKEHLIARR